MIDAISIDNRRIHNDHGNEGVRVVPPSVELQIGILKEVAMGLLRQLDLLNKVTTRAETLEGRNLYDEVREFEIELINTALAQTHGHQRKAARLLGLKVTTLNAKMKRYKIMSRLYLPIGETPGRS